MLKLTAALLVLLAVSQASAAQRPPRPEKPGVKTPGVQIPIAQLKPEAVYEVPGTPDWLAIDEHMWVSNEPKDTVSRLDPKTSTVVATVRAGKRPCSGLAVGFGSLWVPNCGDQTLARVDLKTSAVTATIPTTIASSEGGIATGASQRLAGRSTNAARSSAFDPATNKPVAEIHLPPGSYGIAFGEGAVWVTSTDGNSLTRVDPATNLIVETIPVGKAPRFLAVGEGAVWTLNQGDGSISRVDPKTNKVVATIEAGIPGDGGEIAAGEGFGVGDGVRVSDHAHRSGDQQGRAAVRRAGRRRHSCRPWMGVAVESAAGKRAGASIRSGSRRPPSSDRRRRRPKCRPGRTRGSALQVHRGAPITRACLRSHPAGSRSARGGRLPA